MHRSFADFCADADGVRTRYLLMLERVAAGLAGVPGVIGYDLINEPWGSERRDLAPLYRDAAAAIRGSDPSAILFVEGHVTTNCGLQTRLPRPTFGNVADAPHFYHPRTILLRGWRGQTFEIDRAFAHMEAKGREWGVPLFIGEFGAPAGADRVGEYVSYLYNRLDAILASGAQWSITPQWNERDADGWNGEDFNMVQPDGLPRPNFPSRPYPRSVAGIPQRFSFGSTGGPGRSVALELTWDHDPRRGATELFVPARLFPPTSTLEIEGDGAACQLDEASQRLICTAPRPGTIRVRITSG
jgi:endoglycosylceramidase